MACYKSSYIVMPEIINTCTTINTRKDMSLGGQACYKSNYIVMPEIINTVLVPFLP